MALLASLRHATGHVVGIRSLLEIRQVTGDALRRRTGILAAGVALGALDSSVRPGEGKRCFIVIEIGIAPGARVVTVLAGLRNPGCDVIRVRSLLEIGQVTRDTRSAESGKDAAGVALRTLCVGVCARQSKFRHGVVIKAHAHPCGGVVAHGAFLRETGGLVWRIIRGIEILDVATGAGRARAGKDVVQVAR